MSIETEEELAGLRRAGRVVAVVLRELRRRVQPGVAPIELARARRARAATIVVTGGRPLVLTA